VERWDVPIYEFYCSGCNTIFNFFSGRINTEKRPVCPRCGKGLLDRVISGFSVLRGAKQQEDMPMPELDEAKLGKAMSLMEKEAGNMTEDDPGQAGHFMRKVCDTAGIDLGPGMDEALRRMEAGEDPDRIEAEMGDILTDKDALAAPSKASRKIRGKHVERDETLYYL
jgi:putative FmdB family regulatory protein